MSSKQRLVFSILEFLNSECESGLEEDESESLEVVVECLERVYNVSTKSPSDTSKFHVEKPLTEIFESATKISQTLPTAENKEKAEQLKAQGNKLMTEGKYEGAVDCYDKALELDWTNAVYLCNRAAACSKLGKHDEAVKNCEKALQLDPKYSKAYGRMGTAHMALENYQEAKNSFAKAKELDPNNDLYITNLKTAEEKLNEAAAKGNSSSGSQGAGGGAANLMNSLFSNPGIMNLASQFIANPQMQQMMTNMMSGFGQPAGQEPASQPAGQEPASQPAEGPPADEQPASGGQPNSSSTTTPGSNSGTAEPNPAAGFGGSSIFQFATQMAQQLEQSNPELINNLRQTMQNARDDPNPQDPKTEDPS